MAINKPLSHSCMRESGCCFSRMESIHRMGCRFHQGYSLIDSDFSVVFEVRIDMDGRIIRVKFQLRDMQMSAGKILCAEPEAKAIGTVLALIGEITATAAGERALEPDVGPPSWQEYGSEKSGGNHSHTSSFRKTGQGPVLASIIS